MADAYGASRGGRLSDEFWDLLAAGQFAAQRCGRCGHVRFPPTTFCPQCHGIGWSWQPVSGAGTLWSVTTVRVAPSPDLQDDVPYHLGVVALAEGPLVLGRLVLDGTGDAGADPAIGTAVALVVDPPAGGGDRARYHFRPVPA
ncbi:MAG TPA: Zn-ribbon domain-containing OB-fold protein [Acidimicrobiales bacterium]|nr:Zn-ribbon domain-containing OB-fold protein [Acidimicrobiales bacterium]